MINVKGLTKNFEHMEVLKGIDETIEKGEKVVIIGPSGSGKSTFLRCLNLIERPSGGQIILKVKISRRRSQKRLIRYARKWAWFSSTLTCFPI